ncbi:MAG TPA: YceH family protein [Solirubrobacteraceae bacterium]
MDLTTQEQRVLGCLLEKQRTTPDAYPLTLNALRLACNQATNRDPVVDYDEHTIREALERLGRIRWTRYASGQGSRAPKYRHMLDETLGIAPDEQAVLTVLLLRGPQTPGELKTRTDRLHHFADLAALQGTLERLQARDLVRSAARRPGQKEERWEHLLGEDDERAPGPSSAESAWSAPAPTLGRDRLTALEAEVRDLREELAALRRVVDGMTGDPC